MPAGTATGLDVAVDDQNEGRWSRRRKEEAARRLTARLRWTICPTLCLPASLACLGASVTGQGLPLALALALVALPLSASVGFWWRAIRLSRAIRRRDDDEQGWRDWWGGDPPPGPDGGPDGGPGGIAFDWPSFEGQFWSHVRDIERARESEVVYLRG